MEEVQRKGAVHTLLDWFRPQQGAGDAIHPAGVQTTDNTDETAREDGVSVLRKFVGKKVGVTKPFLAVISLLLLSGVLLRVSSKSKSPLLMLHGLGRHNEWASLYLYGHIKHGLLYELDEAAGEMFSVWNNSGQPVKEAFQRHFTPSLDDGQALTENPLAAINEHVTKMQKCKFPFDSSAKVQRGFLQHVELLVSICRMVTIRLKELKHSVSSKNYLEEIDSSPYLKNPFGVSTSMNADEPLDGVGMLGSERRQPVGAKVVKKNDLQVLRTSPFHEDPDSNSGIKGSSRSFSLMNSDNFLAEVGILGSEPTKSVERKSASKLVALLLEEQRHHICRLTARYYFERFLQPFGDEDAVKATPSSAKHEIPYSGQPFRTGALAQAAARIFRESEDNTGYARVRKIHRMARNWTDEGVCEAIEQQKEENMYNLKQRLLIRREQMRVLLEKGIQNSDLEMNVLFLL